MRQVGKYQLVRKLAAGGMAEVFLAKAAGPHGFEKVLVLKRILPHLAEEPAFVKMFFTEAMLAARLTHPNIAQIFDFGEADGAYFLAMEYVDGPSLRTLIRRSSARGLTLPFSVCARLISQACEGLAFAHDFTDPESGELLGLIHRDVSPDNILLSRQGAVKVVDFGIAKATGQGHKTDSGVIKGKLSYMAPEQLRAMPLDRRTDVYALGVVLYELLTGQKPFQSDSDAGLMGAILFTNPVPAERLRPELPEALRHILARALARDREQRYPDCHVLQADLEAFIVSEGKLVTGQQVARLILETTSSTDIPVQAPPSGPPSDSVDSLVAPVPSEVRTTEVTQRDASTEISSSRAPGPAERERTRELQRSPYSSRRRFGWMSAVLLGLLLAVGMGMLLKRTASPMRGPVASLPAISEPIVPVTPPVAMGGSPPERVEAPAEPAPMEKPTAPVRKSASARSAPRVKRSAPVVGTGTLVIRPRPYAEVFLDGTRLGFTPLAPMDVAAGRHTVRLVNPELGKTRSLEVEVSPGETEIIKHNFQQE
nr:serine/threonine-protein kinase [Melittangium boletus]